MRAQYFYDYILLCNLGSCLNPRTPRTFFPHLPSHLLHLRRRIRVAFPLHRPILTPLPLHQSGHESFARKKGTLYMDTTVTLHLPAFSFSLLFLFLPLSPGLLLILQCLPWVAPAPIILFLTLPPTVCVPRPSLSPHSLSFVCLTIHTSSLIFQIPSIHTSPSPPSLSRYFISHSSNLYFPLLSLFLHCSLFPSVHQPYHLYESGLYTEMMARIDLVLPLPSCLSCWTDACVLPAPVLRICVYLCVRTFPAGLSDFDENGLRTEHTRVQ